MRKVTLRFPTKAATDLGVVNARFFRNNESLEVLQSFAAGNAVTQIVRIGRRNALPPNALIERRRPELLGRYALGHFEILARDEARNEVMALIAWRIPRDLKTILAEFRSDLVPTEPFVVGPKETVVSFYPAENRVPAGYG